ncbi:MAG: protein-L-isoaspartate O-methyltransferase [Steroidobacteraceae bacterium]
MTLDIQAAREQMITQQIRTWNVLDERVLQTLRNVSREQFAPEAYRELAFADTNLPLTQGQVMLAPKIEGKILQALNVQSSDQVLLIGAGSGHLAACLGQLADKVRVIEYHPELVEQVQRKLQQATSNNVSIETGDATQLNLDQAYDVIVITGSLPVYDERFQRALKIGGRLFAVVGSKAPMEAVKITRTDANSWQRDSLFETELPALANAVHPSTFVF